MATAQQVIEIAESYVGTKESPAGSNKTAFGEWFGWNGVAWCSVFLSYVFAQVGMSLTINKGTASTDNALAWYRRQGRFSTDPQKGALVFFGPKGNPNHIGLVYDFDNRYIWTIEGNGLPVDTPVLTPTGWRPIGQLAVGDEVIDPKGHPSTVTGVFPQGVRPCYEIAVSDGRRMIADENHRWRVRLVNRSRDYVLTTKELISKLHARPRLPSVEVAPEFQQTEHLPLAPWAVGALLGDGCLTDGGLKLAATESFMVDKMSELLSASPTYHGSNTWGWSGFGPVIKQLGMQRREETKVVPQRYMLASPKDRLELLRGLLDSDGSCDREGRAEFSSSSRQLARQVLELVRSLGGNAGFYVKESPTYTKPDGTVGTGRPAYLVKNIRLADNPFSRPRKAERFITTAERKMVRGNVVKAIKPVESRETVCISVSAASQLYITQDWLVTHNTSSTGGSQINGGEVALKRRLRTSTGIMPIIGYGIPSYDQPVAQSQPVAPAPSQEDDDMSALTITYPDGTKTIVDPSGGVFNAGTPFFGSMHSLKPEEKQGVQSIKAATAIDPNNAGAGYRLFSQIGAAYSFTPEWAKSHGV